MFSELESEIMCGVCHEIYSKGKNEPVLLPNCGHTFCRSCLLKMDEPVLLVCPNCREINDGSSIATLPVNFSQLGIADALKNHKRDEISKCPKHGQPLDIWCSKSLTQICAMCYFLETRHVQSDFLTVAECRQNTIDTIKNRSRLLSQVYLAIKNTLVANEESSRGNIYTMKVHDILQAENSFAETQEELNLLKKQIIPDKEAERGSLLCVAVDSDGRVARLTWENNQMHLYALCDEQVDANITVKMSDVTHMIPTENPTVFLEVASADDALSGRIYINLWGHLRRAQQFLALCQGTLGPTLKGSTFLDVVSEIMYALRGGKYLTKNGTSSKALMSDLEWNGPFQRKGKKGFIAGWSYQREEDETLFGILTRDSHFNLCCPFGEVVSGIEVVETAVHLDPVSEITIVDVGSVIPSFVT